MKEFNLSESKFKVKEYHNGMIMYPEEKVKEFIKKLKEGLETFPSILNKINKLAGNELK